MNYTEWMEEGKREIVRRALKEVALAGLRAPHHFYITFRTQFPGVQITDELTKSYPDEMTVMLNDAFWALEVQDDYFMVDLIFDHQKSTLRIPFKSLVSFLDPGVEFALQFDWEINIPEPFLSNVIFIDQFRHNL
jgi:hypothetical protein